MRDAELTIDDAFWHACSNTPVPGEPDAAPLGPPEFLSITITVPREALEDACCPVHALRPLIIGALSNVIATAFAVGWKVPTVFHDGEPVVTH